MGLFDFFRRDKNVLSDEQKRFSELWDLWDNGKVPSPYAELMTYQSEVNNGGHDQYFFNIENTGDLEKELNAVFSILPGKLLANLKEAYKAYLKSEENDNEETEEILRQCDDVFYSCETEINRILEEYASKIIR